MSSKPNAASGQPQPMVVGMHQSLEQPDRLRVQQHLGLVLSFFFQAEDGIRDRTVTGVQTCALPISCLPITLADPPAGCRAAWQGRGVGGESLQYREEIDDRLCRDLSPLAGRARGVLG